MSRMLREQSWPVENGAGLVIEFRVRVPAKVISVGGKEIQF